MKASKRAIGVFCDIVERNFSKHHVHADDFHGVRLGVLLDFVLEVCFASHHRCFSFKYSDTVFVGVVVHQIDEVEAVGEEVRKRRVASVVGLCRLWRARRG